MSARRSRIARAFEQVLANPDTFRSLHVQLVDCLFEVEPELETDSAILALAKANYEAQGQRMLSRPTWDELRASDAFHMGLRHAAIQEAQAQHRRLTAEQAELARCEDELGTSYCPICGANCILREENET